MQTPKTIFFYFDFLSPYAYFGAHRLQQWQREPPLPDLEIRPIPVLFAGLLNHWGQKGPAEIPAKRIFVFKDAVRRAHQLGLSLSFPPSHPFLPLLPLRLLSQLTEHPKLLDLIVGIFDLCWGRSQDITTPETLLPLLEEHQIPNPQTLIARCAEAEVKQKLRQQTEDAVQAGVFGIPTMRVGDEIFWGQDQLPFLLDHLKQQDPIQHIDINRALNHPATASRL